MTTTGRGRGVKQGPKSVVILFRLNVGGRNSKRPKNCCICMAFHWISSGPYFLTGCLGSGCTEDDGLILRADAKFIWNAYVDKVSCLSL